MSLKSQSTKRKKKNGRPNKKDAWREAISQAVTKLTPEVVGKLKEAFAIGATIEQACFYAEIHPSTYYDWVKKNPELSEEFDKMKEKMPLKAKENIAKKIHGQPTLGDIGLSKWLLERKESDVYGDKTKIEHSGEIRSGEKNEEDEQAMEEFHAKLKENMRKRRLAKEDKHEDTKGLSTNL